MGSRLGSGWLGRRHRQSMDSHPNALCQSLATPSQRFRLGDLIVARALRGR